MPTLIALPPVRPFGLSQLLATLLAWPAAAQMTETATTAPAQAWLLEADLATWTREDANGERTETWGAAAMLVSRGLSESLDVQVGVDGWTHAAAGPSRTTGFAEEWLVRAKWRITPASERGAVALLPYLLWHPERAPEAERVRAGLIVPVSYVWSDDWCSDFQLQVESGESGFSASEWQGAASANVQRRWDARWSGYLEGAVQGLLHPDPAVIGGVGVTYTTAHAGSWDLGVYRGLTDAAEDWQLALRWVWQL